MTGLTRFVCVLCLLFSVTANGIPFAAANQSVAPNLVIIFADDMGYGDVGVYGATEFATPNLDQLAAEGIQFTDFHVAESVCTASRVGLMTGSYPARVGLGGAIGPANPKGIHPDEYLLPELLRDAGYATACIGKWHLGDQHKFLPLQNGFDEFYGLPYSNDMWPYHPKHARFPPLPLMENNAVVNANLLASDQDVLTKSYTEKAVNFIQRHHDQRFFLYLAHNMPHVPLGVSPKFRGQSNSGMYADVIQEIDWSVGSVLAALDEYGIAENTWVIFTSDNGPWLVYGDHAGSAGPFRSGKHTIFEGGFRVPCLMRWPSVIPAGTSSDVMISTMDILPTVAAVVGQPLPSDRVIDGHNVLPVMTHDASAESPWDAYYYFKNDLHAVRSGRWKLTLPHDSYHVSQVGQGGQPGINDKVKVSLALYDLHKDPSEAEDVAEAHPQIVKRLSSLVDDFQSDLKQNSRPVGTVDKPVHLTIPHSANQSIVLSHSLDEVPPSPWRTPYGVWAAEDKYLRGKETPSEHHGASAKGYAEFTDGVFEYQVRFHGGHRHTLGINATKGHLFHIDFKPDEIRIVKNDLDKDGPDRSKVLATSPAETRPGQWVPVRVAIHGDRVSVSIAESTVTARHDYIARRKGSFNLYVGGDAIDFRAFRLISHD
tara:strand:+ start:590767 stop:592728 length:1962 start_codon:yes stop_codon:yes gene_type:complete